VPVAGGLKIARKKFDKATFKQIIGLGLGSDVFHGEVIKCRLAYITGWGEVKQLGGTVDLFPEGEELELQHGDMTDDSTENQYVTTRRGDDVYCRMVQNDIVQRYGGREAIKTETGKTCLFESEPGPHGRLACVLRTIMPPAAAAPIMPPAAAAPIMPPAPPAA